MSATHRTRRALVGVSVGVVAVLLASCTGERPKLADETSTTTTTEPTSTTEPEPQDAEVAEVDGPSIDVYATEDATSPDRQVSSGVDTSLETIPIVFLVKDREDGADRVEVYLPVEPNGTSGWIDLDQVSLKAVPYRIEIDLTAHQLVVRRDDEVVLDEPAGVGCDDRLTAGLYYLEELLETPDPDGAYGPYAYGLSASSNLVAALDDGEVTAIHGTDEPDTVGADVSSGCIRLDNATIERMAEELGLPLGTPVEVRA